MILSLLVSLLLAVPHVSVSPAQVRLIGARPLRLIVTEKVSSKTAHVGDAVHLRVVGDVMAGDLVVIADRTPVVGTVSVVRRARRLWRPGELRLDVHSVTAVNGCQIPLSFDTSFRGRPTDADDSWKFLIMMTAGWGLLALPLAPLQHGNEAELEAGTLLEPSLADGTAIGDRASVTANQPVPADERQGPARIYAYVPVLGSTVELWCGAAKLVELGAGNVVQLQQPPGQYWFRAETRYGRRQRSEPVALDVDDGKDYFLRVSEDTDVLHVEAVPGWLGAAETEFCRPVVPKHPERITREQLQARPEAFGKKGP
jgi:hypothetical protein